MREIKFRGKKISDGCWVYGDLLNLYDGRRYIIDNKFGACIDSKNNFINTGEPFVNEVYPTMVGQYTDLKDKNGKEIYEGDILGGIWENFYLKYCNKCKEYTLHDVFCLSDCYSCLENVRWIEVVEDNELTLEVVGNIYESEE